MKENREITLSEDDAKAYGKLHAAHHDLSYCVSYALFILKQGWKAKPWSRGSAYLQQSAFVTAMITSYGRAFTKSKEWPKFPIKPEDVYDADELALHSTIMGLRHQVYAHSDPVSFDVRPWKSDYMGDIERFPLFEVSHENIEKLKNMAMKVRTEANARMQDIKSRY